MEWYMVFGVKEYWIVDPKDRSVTVYAFGQGDIADHAVFRKDDEVRSATFEGLDVPLAELFET